jgi:hypothetical protein
VTVLLRTIGATARRDNGARDHAPTKNCLKALKRSIPLQDKSGARGSAGAALVAWAGWPVARDAELRLGLGAVKALRGGELRSPVVELTWTRAFGLGGH